MNTFGLYVCRLSYLINLMTSRKLFMWTRLFYMNCYDYT